MMCLLEKEARGHEFKREQRGEYMGEVGGRKERREMMLLSFNFEK